MRLCECLCVEDRFRWFHLIPLLCSIENNSLLIKAQFNKKGRFSVTVDKKSLMENINHNNKKRFQEQYLNNRMTICEVITESNGGLAKQNSNES